MDNPYLVGFYFNFVFPGGEDAAFQEVSGIGKEWNVEEVVCGGENRFKYRLPTVATFQNLVLKRGRVKKNSPLTEWCRKTLDEGLAVPIMPKNVTVNLLNQEGNTCLSWNFIRAYPVKWSTSDLKSLESEILIETVELAYQYFEIDKG